MLSGLAISALLAELFNLKKFLFPVVCFGLMVTCGVAIYDWNTNIHLYNNMLLIDNYAILFTCVLCIVTLLWFIGANDYIIRETSVTDNYALILFAFRRQCTAFTPVARL